MQSDISFNAMQSAGQGQINCPTRSSPKAGQASHTPPSASSQAFPFRAFTGSVSHCRLDLKSLIAWADGPAQRDTTPLPCTGPSACRRSARHRRPCGANLSLIDAHPGKQHAIWAGISFIPATLRRPCAFIRAGAQQKRPLYAKVQDGLADICWPMLGFVSPFKEGARIRLHRFMENLAVSGPGFPTVAGGPIITAMTGNRAVIHGTSLTPS